MMYVDVPISFCWLVHALIAHSLVGKRSTSKIVCTRGVVCTQEGDVL